MGWNPIKSKPNTPGIPNSRNSELLLPLASIFSSLLNVIIITFNRLELTFTKKQETNVTTFIIMIKKAPDASFSISLPELFLYYD